MRTPHNITASRQNENRASKTMTSRKQSTVVAVGRTVGKIVWVSCSELRESPCVAWNLEFLDWSFCRHLLNKDF